VWHHTYMKLTRGLSAIAFVLMVSGIIAGQQSAYPNELKGYEFFGSGKLSGLRLVTSGKTEVRAQFGKGCEKTCDYDPNWKIHFEYFEDIWTTESHSASGGKTAYSLDPKYLGKLRIVRLIPKNEVFLSVEGFSPAFTRTILTSTSDRASGKSRMTVSDAFSDEFGLTYEIYNRTKYDDIKDTPKRTKGELVAVKYELTQAAQKELFIQMK
jgi:hypothetical protein